MGLWESTFAGHPKNLYEAIEIARDAKDMYVSLPGQRNMGKQVSSLQHSIQDLWSAQRTRGTRANAINVVANNAPTGTNNQNGSSGQGVNTPAQDNRSFGPCPACDEVGHTIRDYKNRKNQYFTCCRI